jgi:CheY-like chemotaxis protein
MTTRNHDHDAIALARAVLFETLTTTRSAPEPSWQSLETATSCLARALSAAGATIEEVTDAVRSIVHESFESEGSRWRAAIVVERVARFATAASRRLGGHADAGVAHSVCEDRLREREAGLAPRTDLQAAAAVVTPGAVTGGAPAACHATVYWPRSGQGKFAGTGRQTSVGGRRAVGPQTVLLVEDDDDLRAVEKRILTEAGYPVIEASSGPRALQLFTQHLDSIALLVTDVMMPGMNGRALVAQLASLRRGLKVLYVSGCIDDPFVRRRASNPIGAFLSKPFRPEGLLRKVGELLTTPAGSRAAM